MSDPRHKRDYPEGIRRETTPAWKARVKQALADNARADVFPRNQAELAHAIGVHRTAITKMMHASGSKLVDPICAVLPVGPPTLEATVEPPVVEMVRRLDENQQRDVLDFIRKYIIRGQ